MKFKVKLRKTIILEQDVEVEADTVVSAMNQAEEAGKAFFPEDEQSIPKKESKWAAFKVTTKEDT